MQNVINSQPASNTTRLHYVDWLRVIATLGVFLFHALVVFSQIDFHIKNVEQSEAITILLGFLFPWGMPLFFLIAGASSWFALRRRAQSQYVYERLNRLLVPFVIGSLVLSPIQRYFEWSHKIQTGVLQGSFLEFIQSLAWEASPRFFGVVGYHLWFLGFLFCYSLLTLPLFGWLKGGAGQKFVSRIARPCEYRGGILLFILPLLLVRLSLHSVFPYEHDWADFLFLLCFFILGYLLFADKRFTEAVRRDWLIMLIVGIAAFLGFVVITAVTGELDIQARPRTLMDYAWWGFVTICSWCWTALMLFVGMRLLDFSNKWLQYAQQAMLPFFMVHQPTIIVIAYFVVQWDADILPKLLVLILGAFAVSLGLYQFVIRRIGLLRAMFGMKSVRSGQVSALGSGVGLARLGG